MCACPVLVAVCHHLVRYYPLTRGYHETACFRALSCPWQDLLRMDMAVDFRQGSPCQQAASELMDPGSFGADRSQQHVEHNAQPGQNPTYPGPPFPMPTQTPLQGHPFGMSSHQPLPHSQLPSFYPQPWNFGGQQGFLPAYSQQFSQPYCQPQIPRFPDPYWQGMQQPPFQQPPVLSYTDQVWH